MTRYEQGFLTKCAELGVDSSMVPLLVKLGKSNPITKPSIDDRVINFIHDIKARSAYNRAKKGVRHTPRSVNWARAAEQARLYDPEAAEAYRKLALKDLYPSSLAERWINRKWDREMLPIFARARSRGKQKMEAKVEAHRLERQNNTGIWLTTPKLRLLDYLRAFSTSGASNPNIEF